MLCQDAEHGDLRCHFNTRVAAAVFSLRERWFRVMRTSVCIPTVRATTLEYAVRSVLRQTFEDWELVVVGQGAEAPPRGATERAAAGDPRIRYIHLDRWGACAARNSGVAASTGEII